MAARLFMVFWSSCSSSSSSPSSSSWWHHDIMTSTCRSLLRRCPADLEMLLMHNVRAPYGQLGFATSDLDEKNPPNSSIFRIFFNKKPLLRTSRSAKVSLSSKHINATMPWGLHRPWQGEVCCRGGTQRRCQEVGVPIWSWLRKLGADMLWNNVFSRYPYIYIHVIENGWLEDMRDIKVVYT